MGYHGRRPLNWIIDDTGGRFKTHVALLHKSCDRLGSPFPGQIYPATSVTGVPNAVKPFRTATRTWSSAT